MSGMTDREMLIKLSTQLDGLSDTMSKIERNVEKVERDVEKVDTKIDKKIDGLQADLKKDYVTKAEFEPVKKAVYGFIAAVITTVILALIGFVMSGGVNVISNVP